MGDRGNIIVKQDKKHNKNQYLYLYTHWDGGGVIFYARNAIQRGRGRWTDPEYLTRIISSEMLISRDNDGKPLADHTLNNLLGETGFGISVGVPSDNEHALVFIDIPKKTVNIIQDSTQEVLKSWSFEDFVGLPEKYEECASLLRSFER